MPMLRVNDRIKEIPAQTLRAVFAGIGQMLLVADKLRARAAEQISSTGAAPATRRADDAPRPADTSAPAAPPPAPKTKPGTSRWRSLDETGNVRLLGEGEEEGQEDLLTSGEPQSTTAPEPASAAEPAAEPAPAAPPEPAAAPGPAAAADTATPSEPTVPKEPATPPEPVAESEPAAAATPTATELPVANYDQLSIASLRARLRMLDTSQVTVLLDYEKAHEGRPAVVTMFERRIAKLTESS
jgi:hypothetical protein